MGGAGFSGYIEAIDPREGRGATGLGHCREGISNKMSSLFGDHFPNDLGWIADRFAAGGFDRLHDLRSHEATPIGYHRHSHRDLKWRDRDRVPHRHAGDGEFVPPRRRVDKAGNFAGEVDAKPLAEPETADILVVFFTTHHHRHLRASDI